MNIEGMTEDQVIEVAAQLKARDKEIASLRVEIAELTALANTHDADFTALDEKYQAEIGRLRERVTELEPAAECWDALCKCYRITCMGSAGLGETKHPNGYAHATFNLWTIAPGHEPVGEVGDAQSLHGATMLGNFMEIAIKNHPLTPPSQAPVAASLRGPEGEARRDVGGEKL